MVVKAFFEYEIITPVVGLTKFCRPGVNDKSMIIQSNLLSTDRAIKDKNGDKNNIPKTSNP
jgi:hypothetical protein